MAKSATSAEERRERTRQRQHDWYVKWRAAMSPEGFAAFRKLQDERSRAYLAGIEPELKSERAKASRLRHVEQRRADCREWRKRNAERVAEYNRQWLSDNKELVAKLNREYRATHKAERNAKLQARWRADLRYRIEVVLRSRVRTAVRRRRLGSVRVLKAADLVGCSMGQLMDHLAAQFKPGMSWDNHGEWHIDHVVPCAAFDLRDLKQQMECFHFSNLQPLWAAENCAKKAKRLK